VKSIFDRSFHIRSPAGTRKRGPSDAEATRATWEQEDSVPTTRIGDLDLYYEVTGTGEPLLLIMGLGADANAWVRQIPVLSARYRTVTFDNRGVGRSSKPPGPYSTAQMADEAAGLLDHLGIDRAHVLGLSMGGMIAQEVTLRHPHRVATLTLACTYPAASPEEQAVRTRTFAAFGVNGGTGDGHPALAAIDPLVILQHMLPAAFSERFIREELPSLLPALTGNLALGFDIAALLGQVAACMAHDTIDRLHQITAPTLVLTGTADRLISPRHSDLLAAHIAGARLVRIPDGPHALNLEMADAFNAEVLRFLAAHPLRGG